LTRSNLNTAKLFASALKKPRSNEPYVAEFLQRVEVITKEKPSYFLLEQVSKIKDYFQWEYILQICSENNDNDSYNILSGMLVDRYPNSPKIFLDHYHLGVANGSTEDSVEAGKELIEQFPANEEFHIMLAAALIKDKDYVSAIRILQVAEQISNNEDLDILQLQALAYGNYCLEKDSPKLRKQSIDLLQRAVQAVQQAGFSAKAHRETLKKLEQQEEQSNGKENTIPVCYWYVNLRQEEYNRLKSRPLEDIQDLRFELSFEVLRGDILVFGRAGKEKGEDMLKVVALYKAASDNYYHPIDGIRNDIALLSRPEQTTLVPGVFETGSPNNDRQAVFRLGEEAVSEIMSQMERSHRDPDFEVPEHLEETAQEESEENAG
jgi:tetratricopeptide (TPR) repeat protein